MIAVLLCWVGTALAISPSERLMLSGNVAGALDVAVVEARTQPDDIDAQERLIDILLTVRMPGRAVQIMGDRVKASPTDPDAHYLFGRAVPDAEQAQVAYERALKLEPLHARSHMGMGAIHTARRDFTAAEAAYARAVRIEPALAEAWLGVVRSQLALERLPDAVASAREAIAAVPDNPEAYLTLSVIAPAEARQVLEQAVAAAGHDPRVHAGLAELLLKAGDGAGALAAAEAARAIDPTEPVATRVRLYALAMADGHLDIVGYEGLMEARAKGDLPRANALVKRYPRAVVSWLTRSQLRVQRGDVAGGIADLDRALKLDGDEAETLGQLGVLLAQEGDHARAADLLKRAFAKRPYDAGLGRAAGLEIARAGDTELAIELLNGLRQRMPYTTSVTIALADALLLAGQPERAYQVVLDAADKRPDDKLIVAMVAAATQAGRYAEAAGMLEEIGASTGNATALELAERLRTKAATQP